MKSFAEQLAELVRAGYRVAEAQAKVAHDVYLPGVSCEDLRVVEPLPDASNSPKTN